MAEIKPTWPTCEGHQYATANDAGHYVEMHYDESGNEIPGSGDFMHENSTPGNGSSNYGAEHYANEFRGSYGVSVNGGSPSREATTVNAQSTERGKES